MEIRDYQKGDEKSILDLFEISFKKKMDPTFWNWRFITNPENKLMIKLMWDNDKLAGHYAISPLKLRIDDEIIQGAISMTTMTHPDYAGKGIFSRLAEELYTYETERNNLKVIYGYPNNNSHYAFIKNLKWKNLEQVPSFSLKSEKLKSVDSTSIKIINQLTENHLNAIHYTTKDFRFKIEKTLSYLNWRYLKNPLNKYEVFEFRDGETNFFAVAKSFFSDIDTTQVDIVELFFPADYDLLLRLMNAIKLHYKNVLQINMWLPLNDGKHIQLEKMGFVNDLPITYSGIRIMDESYNNLIESNSWHFSMGNSDIY